MNTPQKVLMVCLGNICRSPSAHGVLAHLVQQAKLQHAITIDSAGTAGYHIGNPPDARSQQHAQQRGYDLSTQRARKLQAQDFEIFDWILVMDSNNHRDAIALCPAQHQHKIHYLTKFCRNHNDKEVPDPYYGGNDGFEYVLDLCEDACGGLLSVLQNQTAL